MELAPAWHTGALATLILAVAVTGSLLTRGRAQPILPAAESAPAAWVVLGVYLPAVVVQFALVVYVCRVARPAGTLAALVGRRWNTMARAAGDVGIAAVALAAILLLELAWTNAVGRYATSVCLPLPGTVGERVAWTWVALSVGVCEEIVYRGYFLGQLTARSGRPVFGLLAQAALFGVAHLDRGPAGAILAGLDGLLLGVVARARGSLLPGMMCHGAVDAMSGWLAGAG